MLRSGLSLPLVLAIVSAACTPQVNVRSAASALHTTVTPPASAGGEVDLTALANATCSAAPTDSLGIGSFLDEFSDLSSLARLSNPSFTSRLSSSFDRTSSHAQPGDADWFANRDFAEPQPGQPVVLLDAIGPGVVTRIWSANPTGTVRIYIDGASRPVIEAPFASLLDGEVAPFTAPFAVKVADGHNLYFPIPFRRACRITVETDASRFFYQVDHRRYPADTRIESFSRASLTAADCQRTRAAARLALAQNASLTPLQTTEAFSLTVTPGKRSEHRLAAASGGTIVRELRIRPARFDAVALRGTMLAIEFDGQPTVQAPLGDFFGTGPGLSRVHSVPITVDAERGILTARWPMPFRDSAVIALTGASDATFEAAIEVATEPHGWTDDTLLFGARWHAAQAQRSTPPSDWELVSIQGAGKYVGTLLNVQNGDILWWGEGDERVWVDNDAFPSHFGTGTEDYFGYGWCSNERFTVSYIGQTQSSGKQNWGATSLYRFHIADAIPFQSKLRFDLEIRHWRKTPTPLTYDGISYFYVRPGAVIQPKPPGPDSYRVPVETNPPLEMSEAHYTCGGD
jgi:hypothetical protein